MGIPPCPVIAAMRRHIPPLGIRGTPGHIEVRVAAEGRIVFRGPVSRRAVLRAGAASTAALSLAGCASVFGASAVPTDLQEMFHSYNLPRMKWWRKLILPAVFPSIVTGAITAAGGAWNASIVAEFVSSKDKTYIAHGIGALLTTAYQKGQYALLGAGIFTLCLMVVLLNKFLWRRLYGIAQERFALNT